ncbi:glycosyltransferase family 2 protein [Enterococcus sp. AZ109]|uniref:glycosyltransferase family 2 protein n=1 Tax=Enterococcus sp. AZ109 TaxID=2774634 RepID=UPI003F1F6280
MKNEVIRVSVCITTYNHENYIRQALESVVTQKTKFHFEVIVHDDASTDNTPKIIREYMGKYPDLVKGILQKENQVSQGVNIDQQFILPLCQGEYMAFLEGDDYWVDSYKLQKQYTAMQRNTFCSICVHRVEIIDESGQAAPQARPSKKAFTKDMIISGSEYLMFQEYLFQTGSYFFKTDYMKEFMNSETKLIRYFNGDDCILRWAIQKGAILFLNDTMSVYRVNVPEGWSTNYAQHSKVQRIEYLKRSIQAEQIFNEESHFRFRSIVEGKILIAILTANSYSHQEAKALMEQHQKIITAFIERKPKNQFEKYIQASYKVYKISPTLHKIMRKLNHMRKKMIAE